MAIQKKEDEFQYLEEIIKMEKGKLIAEDPHTGNKRIINADPRTLLLYKDQYLQYEDPQTKEIYWMPKASPDHISPQTYNPLIAENIIYLVTIGESLQNICKRPHMPSYPTLCRWRKEHTLFDRALYEARTNSAEVYFHKMIETVEKASPDAEEIQLAKLKADTYKYAAKVFDPRSFSESIKIDQNVKHTFGNLETGIRRRGDLGFNEDEIIEIERQVLDECESGDKLLPGGDNAGNNAGATGQVNKDDSP